MTTAVKEKKPFLPQRKVQAPAAGGTVAVRPGAVARPAVGPAALSIGGEPRVHLLPVDVIERKKLKFVKRRLLTAGLVVVGVVAIAYGAATFELTAAQGQLDAAHTNTSQLLTQQAKYSQVTKVQSDMAAITAAQKATTTQEILWQPFLSSLEKSLPAGASVQSVNATIDNPLGGTVTGLSSTGSVPLQGPRIATVNVTVSIQQGNIPNWLNALPSLTGFVDATPGSVTAPTGGGTNYTVAVTIHLNAQAVSGRFTTPAPSASTTTGGNN